MNTLEQKLAKSGENKLKEAESILNDVKMLLAGDQANELELLKSIGLDSHIKVAQAKQQDVIIRNSNKDKYGRQVVHISEIKKLCKNYRLYMRKTTEYMGVVPPELGSELIRFCKETNIAIPSHSDYSNFAIIAPPKMFRGYKNPIEVVEDAFNVQKLEREERIRKAKEDPILVYRLVERPDYFVIVKSWGKDFTPLRRLYGMLTRPISLKWINFLFTTLLVVFALKYAWEFMMYTFTKVEITKNEIWGVGGVVSFGLVILFSGLWLFHEDFKKIRNRILRMVTYDNDKHSIDQFTGY